MHCPPSSSHPPPIAKGDPFDLKLTCAPDGESVTLSVQGQRMRQTYGLIFDVDGVIADSESVNVRATLQAFAEVLGISGMRVEDFEAGIGRGAVAYVRAGAAAHGRTLASEEVDRLVRRRQETFLSLVAQERLPAYPGVRELMASALADAEWRLAIATSSTRDKSQAVLEAADVPWAEMVRLCGDDVTHAKPNPELFSLACGRLQLTPRSCVVIEDAPAGVEAAQAAGCACIAVTNTHAPDRLKRADLTVESLAEVTLDTLRGVLQGH